MPSISLGPEYVVQPPNLSVLSDKNVLITGGASGLGAAINQKFAENTAHIASVDIQAEKGRIIEPAFGTGSVVSECLRAHSGPMEAEWVA
jgi:NAD(P)-dependent dehydrogenase (short-subunit alcohol dehydrogenase family)